MALLNKFEIFAIPTKKCVALTAVPPLLAVVVISKIPVHCAVQVGVGAWVWTSSLQVATREQNIIIVVTFENTDLVQMFSRIRFIECVLDLKI